MLCTGSSIARTWRAWYNAKITHKLRRRLKAGSPQTQPHLWKNVSFYPGRSLPVVYRAHSEFQLAKETLEMCLKCVHPYDTIFPQVLWNLADIYYDLNLPERVDGLLSSLACLRLHSLAGTSERGPSTSWQFTHLGSEVALLPRFDFGHGHTTV